MLFKLFVVAAVAHSALASQCCLPDSFQFTALSETRYQNMGAMRGRVIMAMNASQGMAGIFTFTEQGYNSMMYANLRTNKMHVYNPPYGCYEMPNDGGMLSQLNGSRCLPDDIASNGSLSIRLADGLNARLYAKSMGNSTFHALVSETCKPIIIKVSSPDFDSTNIIGDFLPGPQPGLLDLPAACRNATSVGLGPSGRKRAAVAVAYNHSPLMV